MIEAMTALAVVTLGLMVAVPSFQGLASDNQRAAAINELVSTMHMARSQAITRNVEVTVCPTLDGEDCEDALGQDGWILFADENQDRQVGPDELVLGSAPAMDQLTIHSDEFERFFVYRPDGHVMVETSADNFGQMTFCDPRGAASARVLIVTVSGKPQLAEHQIDGSEPDCDEA